MNNNYDPQQAYLAQLLAVTQSAQLQVNPYSGQALNDHYVPSLASLNERNVMMQSCMPQGFAANSPSVQSINGIEQMSQQTHDSQHLQLLQTMMMLNNEKVMNQNGMMAGMIYNASATGGTNLANNEPQQRLFNQTLMLNPGINVNEQHARNFENTLERASPVNLNQFNMPTDANTESNLQLSAQITETSVPSQENSQALQQHQSAFASAVDEVDSVSHHLSQKLTKPKPKKRRQDTKWLQSLDELKAFKAKNGHCIVPRGYPLNPRLASWVAEQRKQYKLMRDGKQSSMSERRIELLNEMDFAWNAQEAAWDRHISDLKRFKVEFGDCLVPLNQPNFPKLGLWVKEQRRHYTLMKQGKPSHMTGERAKQLNEIGFCWDTHEAVWGERLRELCQYKALYGDCAVPTNYAINPKLGTWVHHQRRQYKKFKEGELCHITEERIGDLESLGFVWYPRERVRANQLMIIKEQSCGTSSEEGGVDEPSDTVLEDLDIRPLKRKKT